MNIASKALMFQNLLEYARQIVTNPYQTVVTDYKEYDWFIDAKALVGLAPECVLDFRNASQLCVIQRPIPFDTPAPDPKIACTRLANHPSIDLFVLWIHHSHAKQLSWHVGWEDLPQHEQSICLDLYAIYEPLWQAWSYEKTKQDRLQAIYQYLWGLLHSGGGSLPESIECVWGQGVMYWKDPTTNTNIRYPLCTQKIHMVLQENTQAIVFYAGNNGIVLETAPWDFVGKNQIQSVQNALKNSLETLKIPELSPEVLNFFSPTWKDNWETIKNQALSALDANAIYTETYTQPTMPVNIHITQDWVVCLRKKNSAGLLEDLQQFVHIADTLDNTAFANVLATVPALDAFFTPPASTIDTTPHQTEPQETKQTDTFLYFPLPYNKQQEAIVQNLLYQNGMVVEGPPGTGKTHTIANIICHYLAMGKKILVTSQGNKALNVLQSKIPPNLRELTIHVSSDSKNESIQLANAIETISTNIKNINEATIALEIQDIETRISQCKNRIHTFELALAKQFTIQSTPITLDSIQGLPGDIAHTHVAPYIDKFAILLPDGMDTQPGYNLHVSSIKLNEAKHTACAFPDHLSMLQHVGWQQYIPNLESAYAICKPIHIATLHQNLCARQQSMALLEEHKLWTIEFWETAYTHAQYWQSVLSLPEYAVWREYMRLDAKSDAKSDSKSVDQSSIWHKIMVELEKLLQEVKQCYEKSVFHGVELPSPQAYGLQNIQCRAILKQCVAGKKPWSVWDNVAGNGKKIQSWLQAIVVKKQAIPMEQAFKKHFATQWQHIWEQWVFKEKLGHLQQEWNRYATVCGFKTWDTSATANWLSIYDVWEEIQQNTTVWEYVFYEIQPKGINIEFVLDQGPLYIEHHKRQAVYTQYQQIMHTIDTLPLCFHTSEAAYIRQFLGALLPEYNIETNIETAWASMCKTWHTTIVHHSALTQLQSTIQSLQTSGATILASQWFSNQIPWELWDTVSIPNTPDIFGDIFIALWEKNRLWGALKSIDTQYMKNPNNTDSTDVSVQLHQEQEKLKRLVQDLIEKKTLYRLKQQTSPKIKAALTAWQAAKAKLGKGTGQSAQVYRQAMKTAMLDAQYAVPCWIMSHDSIYEMFPAQLGLFDLVIIDEASQSDWRGLPAILRGKKVLIVGDDKQVSPADTRTFADTQQLRIQYLKHQIPEYKDAFPPGYSLYDLYKTVFAHNTIGLQEHFRCDPAIIEYSNRNFYNGQLQALRIPKYTEKAAFPLVDIYIPNGLQDGKKNDAEAHCILQEIQNIIQQFQHTPKDTGHYVPSIGIIPLMGGVEQVDAINRLLYKHIAPQDLQKHKLVCQDSKSFQGEEKDIIFLSLVCSKQKLSQEGDWKLPMAASGRDEGKRFNVAASRARNQMYLIRSVSMADLRPIDTRRIELLQHFAQPFMYDATTVQQGIEACESKFETDIYTYLATLGYSVVPQVTTAGYRIDMVVYGTQDNKLAIECDGDMYHTDWLADYSRQQVLERVGWVFWRCFASKFYLHKDMVLQNLVQTLEANQIYPKQVQNSSGTTVHTEAKYPNPYTDYREWVFV
jgi:very-short-patch-repair endonuclease